MTEMWAIVLVILGIMFALALINMFYYSFIEEPINAYVRGFCSEHNQPNTMACYQNYTISDLLNYIEMTKARS
jgi:hypothetical protein